jgi:hypothetical protein
MKTVITIIGALTVLSIRCLATPYLTSGMDGLTIDGSLSSPLYGYTILNSAPTAIVQNGPEFTASFQDVFGQQWTATADFMDNFQVVFHFSSPNPNANIGAGELILWHFTGFDFAVQGLQEINTPPFQDRSLPSFDQNDIWMGFNGLTAYSPWNTYTYQIETYSIPDEIPTLPLLLMGMMTMMVLIRFQIFRFTKAVSAILPIVSPLLWFPVRR